MTAEPHSDAGGGFRLDRLLLLVPPAIILLVAALTPTASLHPDQNDVALYLDKARSITQGMVPYRDFKLEYPPGALIPMTVPYLAGLSSRIDLGAYKVLFAGWEAFLLLVLGVVIGRIGAFLGDARGPALKLLVLTCGAALAMTWRYDLFPAVLATVAVWAALERRLIVIGVALGIGVLAKLYPIVLLPALALPWLVPLDLARLVRLGATVGLTILVGLLPFVALAGDDAFQFLTYQTGRGLQIESIGGAFVLLAGLVAGDPVRLSFGFGAVQVEGGLADLLLRLLPAVTVVVFAALAWIGWRRVQGDAWVADAEQDGVIRPASLVALAFASLLLLLLTSKVYSIQYVVWIVPFLAFVRGPAFWLGAAVTALTMPIHPVLYGDLVKQEALPILVLNLRNALVVALTAWLIWSLRPSRPTALG